MAATELTEPANPLGVHALVWRPDGTSSPWRRAVEGAAAAGFDLLEIPLRDPSAVAAAALRPQLQAAGLRPVCLLGLPFDADVSSTDPQVAGRGEHLLLAALDVTVELGASYLGGVLYSAAGKYDRPPSAAGRRSTVEVLGRLADKAAGVGVTVGLEVVNRYETNLVNTAAQALALIDEIGAANLVVHLDTYHANIEETDVAAAIRATDDRLGYLHASESNRGPLGHGSVDFPAVFSALAATGYTGPIGFEGFTAADAPPALVASMALWRDHWDDPYAVARSARHFITSGLAIARRGAARERGRR